MNERKGPVSSPSKEELKGAFRPVAEMVAGISGGDVESLYGLREWWAGQVSDFVLRTEPVDLTFNKDGMKRTGKYGVPSGEGKLYCSEQVDRVELDGEKTAKWSFLKKNMSNAAADGLTERWGADGIKSSLASAGGDEEKEKALVRQWIGGQSGPLAGLEGEVLDRLKGVVVEDGEIGMRGASSQEGERKDKKKKVGKKQALIQATEALVAVAEQMQRTSQEAPIPRSKPEQLKMVRGHLDYIESTKKWSRDYALSQRVAMLEEIALSSEIDPDVAREIRARLNLHDCAVLMRKSNGYVETPRSGGDPECPTVGLAATLAEGMGHALDEENITFFLKSDSNGIPVALAWNFYQDVNVDYENFLIKVQRPGENLLENLKTAVNDDPDLGTIGATYYTDGDGERKRRVDDYVIGEIAKRKKVDRITAEKAWRMGRGLALATGENSVFNPGMVGNDEMAEDMYLKLYRKGRDEKGRPRGPQITIDKIVGIGNSWLRQVSGFKIDRGRGLKPMYAEDVITKPRGVRGIPAGSYVYHFAVWWSAKIHPLRGLLLDRAPDPQKICNIDFMQTAVDYFVKADEDGKMRLRYYWVAGVLDLASSIGQLGWTQSDISKFRQFLTKVPLSTSAGTFLKETEWEELMSKGGFVKKMLRLDMKRLGQTAMGSFFGQSGSGGGGRRK